MGTVYLCNDPDLQRPVAIKVLSPRKQDASRAPLRLRFLREALTTAELQHPGVPPVYDVRQQANGQIYYVMKPIEGKPFNDILRDLRSNVSQVREEFDLFRLVGILRRVCQTVQYAHSKGYIHRDIKPSNIFVGDYGEVYVIDWGLTKAVRDKEKDEGTLGADEKPHDGDVATPAGDSTLTRTMPLGGVHRAPDGAIDVTVPLTLQGDVLGTVHYMPPEQASGKIRSLGPQADIYALGVILYEILTFELPIQGANFKEVLDKKLKGEIIPPELRAASREIPPELSAIAMQSMDPNPDERFKSVKEFSEALEFWMEGKSQFRNATRPTISKEDFVALPREARKGWKITREAITTLPLTAGGPAGYLLLAKEFIGDIRFSMNVIAYPVEEGRNRIAEFALVVSANAPKPWRGLMDAYTIHLAANGNTRAVISRKDAEVVSNEYLVLEPRRRYRLMLERTGNEIRVLLNRQVILFYHDRNPLSGLSLGFRHVGANIAYSNIRVQSKGLPTRIPSIEVPEALLQEGCFEGAMKRFLAIAVAHKDRYEGAWARYRAGIASYQLTHDRKEAVRIWAPLRKGPYALFESLGRAWIELENRHHLHAAQIIQALVSSGEPIPHVDPVADIAFDNAQQFLRQTPQSEKDWQVVDAWVRLALILGQRLEAKETLTPSILWRWILLALTKYPQHLSECILFLRDNFGKGQGAFADILTTIDPLMTILKRSAAMADNAFLMDKVMRLILNYDDNLGNLETIARFYLHSGHEDVTRRISQHICDLCKERNTDMPPMPIAFVACLAWLKNEKNARELIHMMIDQSVEWAIPDGLLLLGLDHYRLGEYAKAKECWLDVVEDPESVSYNRHLVAKGLLGELPPDPVAAKVPNRSDHRLLYCMFVGFKNYLDWRRTASAAAKETGIRLLGRSMALVRPSYDIYSATDTFSRLPLEAMGHPVPPRAQPAPLTSEEEDWLRKLAVAASQEEAAPNRNGSAAMNSSKRPSGSSRRKSRHRRRSRNHSRSA
ncbi:MAG: hypothetical protein A3K19_00850 [Lentisphaerae bacterium RIFOXYB12_FULL_65_16]|nr:MAG: hypothetical protein A3K19_00850 [Lentisphaerae bacterium RIFOXYB12_FULL_65_16]